MLHSNWLNFKLAAQKNRWLLLILTLAFFLRILGIFPNIPYPDEAHIEKFSWSLVKGIVTEGDFNPHTLKYGSSIFYVYALGAAPILLGTYLFERSSILISSSFTAQPLDFEPFFDEAIRKYGNLLLISGRFINILFGVGLVFLTYLIAKALFGKKTGLISGFIMAVAPLAVREAHYMITDTIFLFSVLLTLLLLVNIFKNPKIKWFILSGLALGISITVRFFPIALLPYPIILFLSFNHKKNWYQKAGLSIVAIFVGIFIGMPFFFLDPKGPSLFVEDLNKYALPWYGNSITNYVSAFVVFIASGGQRALPPLRSLLPQYFRPLYASFLFFLGFGIIPSLVAVYGILLAIKKHFKVSILLIIIPFFTFIYMSSYLPATYEKSIFPVVPFLAVFAALAISQIRNKKIFILILVITILQPFLISVRASVACQEKWIQTQSSEWVDKNISDNINVSYLTMVSTPSTKNFDGYFPLTPNKELSIEEARTLGADHAFINSGWLDRFTGSYFVDFFVTPSALYENSYFYLVLKEYVSGAQILNKLTKPIMCDTDRIYYFKLPEKEIEQSDNHKGIESWNIQNFKENVGNGSISLDSGILTYRERGIKYTAPRIRSEKLRVKKDAIYTVSVRAKTPEEELLPQELFLRVDFYEDKEMNLNQKIIRSINLFKHIFVDGVGPTYFEKKLDLKDSYSDINFPGIETVLSERVEVGKDAQKMSVTATSPNDADFMIVSVQSLSRNGSFILDDANIFSD